MFEKRFLSTLGLLSLCLSVGASAPPADPGETGQTGQTSSTVERRPISEQLIVSGRAVDPEGIGLKGVSVDIEPIRPVYERLLPQWQPVEESEQPDALSGIDGFFSIRVARAGIYRVKARAKGYRSQTFQLQPLLESRHLPELSMVPVAKVRVSVRDAEGAVSDARLILQSHRPKNATARFGRRTEWRLRLERAQADEQGKAAFLSGVGETRKLWVTAPGYIPQETAVLQARVTMKLEAGRSRWIQIADTGGEPISGAYVLWDKSWLVITRTDDSGRAEIFVPKAGDLPIRLILPDGRQSRQTIHDAAADAPALSITVDPPQWIDGQVLEAESRRAIADAFVLPITDPGAAVQTDAKGRFRLLRGENSYFSLSAAAAGYVADSRGRLDTVSADQVLTLKPAARIQGRTLNVAGEAVAFARVEASVLGQPRRMMFQRRLTFSGPDGSFSFSGVIPGEMWQLDASKAGFIKGEMTLKPLEPFELRKRQDIVLRIGRQVYGRVVTEQDEAIKGAEIRLVEEVGQGNMSSYFARMMRGGPPTIETSTDGEGRFAAKGLNPEKVYRLKARASGFAPSTVPGIRLEVDGAASDLGSVVLLPGAIIEGVVVDKDAQPLKGAELTVSPTDSMEAMLGRSGTQSPVYTNTDGTFRLVDRIPGEGLTLTASLSGYADQRVANLKPSYDSEPIRIVLIAAARVSGRVVDPEGRPIKDASVSASASDLLSFGKMPSTSTGADGLFAIDEVPPGIVALSASAKGFQASNLSNIELKEAEHRKDFEITLVPGSTLAGRVIDPEGSPISEAFIAVERKGASNIFQARSGYGNTDADGRFKLEGLVEGTFDVMVRHESFPSISNRVEIGPETGEVEWVMELGTSVRGRVVDDATGQGILGADITLNAGNGHTTAISDDQGLFLTEGLSAGELRAQATKEGYAGWSLDEPIELGAEGLDGLEIRLVKGAVIHGKVLGATFDELRSVMVIASSQSGRSVASVDFEGRFRLEHLAPGEWSLMARLGERSAADTVTLEPGQLEAEGVLEFTEGYLLSGKVFHEGEPLAGAQISLRAQTGGSGSSATTGLDGGFEAENLKEGSYLLILTEPRMRLRHRREIRIPEEQEVLLELRSTRIMGTVRDARSGEGIADASIHLVAGEEEGRQSSFRVFNRGEQVASDSTGAFRLGSLTGGSWKLVVSKDGYAAYEREFELDLGSDRLALDLLLTPVEALSLKVLGPGGVPPKRIITAVLGADDQVVTSGTWSPDNEGRVELTTVPAGSWRLLISGDQGPTVERQINAPGDAGTVVLAQGGTLRVETPGRVADGTSRVRLVAADGKAYRLLNFWSGMAEAETPIHFGYPWEMRVPAGNWTVEVRFADGTVQSRQVAVQDGGSAEVSFGL